MIFAHVLLLVSSNCPPRKPLDASPLPREPRWLAKGVPFFVRWEDYVPRFLCDLTNIFFVQLGANCGLNVPRCTGGGDPVYDYASACGWRGVVLEPVRSTFNMLRKNYAPMPGVQPLHMAAYGGTTGLEPSTMQVTSHARRAKSQNNHLLPDSKGNSSRMRNRKAEKAEKTTAYSMLGLWRKLALTKVDLLVIDIEGAEPTVLSKALPSPLPRLVLFEHSLLRPSDINRINASLISQGYELVAELKHKDAGAVERNLPAQDMLYGLRSPPSCSTHVTRAGAISSGYPRAPHAAAARQLVDVVL